MSTENHIYESNLPTFLEWRAWVSENCTPEELECFLSEDFPISPEKHALYLRWVADQQITKHTIMQDGVVVLEKNYTT